MENAEKNLGLWKIIKKGQNLAKIRQKMKKIDFSFLVPHFSPRNEKLKKTEKREFLIFVQPIFIIQLINTLIENLTVLVTYNNVWVHLFQSTYIWPGPWTDTVFDMEIVEVEEKSPFFLSNFRVLGTIGVQVRNMKMVFNISTLGIGSGNEWKFMFFYLAKLFSCLV